MIILIKYNKIKYFNELEGQQIKKRFYLEFYTKFT